MKSTMRENERATHETVWCSLFFPTFAAPFRFSEEVPEESLAMRNGRHTKIINFISLRIPITSAKGTEQEPARLLDSFTAPTSIQLKNILLPTHVHGFCLPALIKQSTNNSMLKPDALSFFSTAVNTKMNETKLIGFGDESSGSHRLRSKFHFSLASRALSSSWDTFRSQRHFSWQWNALECLHRRFNSRATSTRR